MPHSSPCAVQTEPLPWLHGTWHPRGPACLEQTLPRTCYAAPLRACQAGRRQFNQNIYLSLCVAETAAHVWSANLAAEASRCEGEIRIRVRTKDPAAHHDRLPEFTSRASASDLMWQWSRARGFRRSMLPSLHLHQHHHPLTRISARQAPVGRGPRPGAAGSRSQAPLAMPSRCTHITIDMLELGTQETERDSALLCNQGKPEQKDDLRSWHASVQHPRAKTKHTNMVTFALSLSAAAAAGTTANHLSSVTSNLLRMRPGPGDSARGQRMPKTEKLKRRDAAAITPDKPDGAK